MLEIGTHLGKYVVEEVLGSGGMADVYRVTHEVLGTPFALKVLKPKLLEKRKIRERFLEEGRLLARCKHPNLVRITDVIDQADPPVAGLVMEYLRGQSLKDRLAEGRPPVDQAVSWTLQLLDVLDAIHEQGVVHRDVKPDNLVFDQWDTLRLLDFGIAKVQGTDRTGDRDLLGTPGYMAPEQWKEAAKVTPRADLFAVGSVFYELLTGRWAFDGENAWAIHQNAMKGNVEPIDEPGLARFQPILDHALAVDPADRFGSARAFATALEEAAAGQLPDLPPSPPTLPTVDETWDGSKHEQTPSTARAPEPAPDQPLYVMFADDDDDQDKPFETTRVKPEEEIARDRVARRRKARRRAGCTLFALGTFVFASVVAGLYGALVGFDFSTGEGEVEEAPLTISNELPLPQDLSHRYSAAAGERLQELHAEVARRCSAETSAGLTGSATIQGVLTAEGDIEEPLITLIFKMSGNTEAVRTCMVQALTRANPGNPEGETVLYTTTVGF